MKKIPVLQLHQFQNQNPAGRIYSNDLAHHLNQHDFITKAHRHNFYLLVLFTQGSGSHEVDFISYPVKPGSMFVLKPGQVHQWNLSSDIGGHILFHTSDYFNLTFNGFAVEDFPLFKPGDQECVLKLNKPNIQNIRALFLEIHKEFNGARELKFRKICSLINLVYIELSRLSGSKSEIANTSSRAYYESLKKFEKLIEIHFKTKKLASEYAEMLNISSRHLNRICKSDYGKTATDVILDRIVLEARRLMVNRNKNIGEISLELGYEDPAYFSRVFKNRSAETPTEFMRKYKEG